MVKISNGTVEENEDLHEHGPDASYIDKRECLNNMKRKCFESMEPIPTIYQDCLRELHLKNSVAEAEFQPFEHYQIPRFSNILDI